MFEASPSDSREIEQDSFSVERIILSLWHRADRVVRLSLCRIMISINDDRRARVPDNPNRYFPLDIVASFGSPALS
jgi:hypothetical protein